MKCKTKLFPYCNWTIRRKRILDICTMHLFRTVLFYSLQQFPLFHFFVLSVIASCSRLALVNDVLYSFLPQSQFIHLSIYMIIAIYRKILIQHIGSTCTELWIRSIGFYVLPSSLSLRYTLVKVKQTLYITKTENMFRGCKAI